MARAVMSLTSMIDSLSSIFPRVILETSSRSSTSGPHAHLASDDRTLTLRVVVTAELHQLKGREDGRERVAQLVPEHRQKLVLRSIGLLGFFLAPLQRLVEALPAPSRLASPRSRKSGSIVCAPNETALCWSQHMEPSFRVSRRNSAS